MSTRKAYKYRIYLNKTTTNKLQWVLDRCRELSNAGLSERKDAYKYAGKSIGCFDQINDLPEIKNEIRPEYQEIGSHVLQDVLRRLENAFQNFFDRVKKGQTPGFPASRAVTAMTALPILTLRAGSWNSRPARQTKRVSCASISS